MNAGALPCTSSQCTQDSIGPVHHHPVHTMVHTCVPRSALNHGAQLWRPLLRCKCCTRAARVGARHHRCAARRQPQRIPRGQGHALRPGTWHSSAPRIVITTTGVPTIIECNVTCSAMFTEISIPEQPACPEYNIQALRLRQHVEPKYAGTTPSGHDT
jgi:hypothetical protein